jgi:aminodeoxyfutalosine deaminase
MSSSLLSSRFLALPKAELHLHLEGSIQPATVCALAARHGVSLTEQDVRQRYTYRDFMGFIDAFKWVTSFLRQPADYALVAQDLGEHLLTQGVVYAEVTLSVGVMLLRGQQPEANFEAILGAAEPFESRGLRVNWVFDAVRQFGPAEAMRVVEAAKSCGSKRIVAFGIGGDELSMATEDFRPVYEKAAAARLHLLMHAGEIGPPEKIREAIELLGVERIGHGIAAGRDPALMDFLAQRRIPLEICPQSNIRTGALAKQLQREVVRIEDHPLPRLLRHGIPVALSTDDPAMFQSTLLAEYENAARMGLSEEELTKLAETSFDYAFLSESGRDSLERGYGPQKAKLNTTSN